MQENSAVPTGRVSLSPLFPAPKALGYCQSPLRDAIFDDSTQTNGDKLVLKRGLKPRPFKTKWLYVFLLPVLFNS